MQPSRDASIRAVQPLPKITEACIDSSEPLTQPFSLEDQRETIAQLKQAVNFERLLRQIIEQLHSSLDRAEILQAALRELAIGLEVKGCNLALYDLAAACSVICHECCSPELPSVLQQAIPFANLPDLYQQLLQRQPAQFCQIESQIKPSSADQLLQLHSAQSVCLACPIQDAIGVLGDIWLFKPVAQDFSLLEIQLVQQVAQQCAVALRQIERYEQAKTQVEELERLHQRKDEFLSTVSHELRTPMSNIKMAAQLLEMNLEQLEPTQFLPARRYLKILKYETAREIALINDLLDLSRLEAGMEPLVITTINPVLWLPALLEPFIERAQQFQQQFQADLATYLPPLTTDLGYLERILGELLNNACKYTPAGERIIFSARLLKAPASARSPVFLLSVANSGIEISEVEQRRIFDKFYRIAGHDPWQQGGTGLGLSLVKGLVERLSGQLRVESYAGLTRFTVELPSRPPEEPQ